MYNKHFNLIGDNLKKKFPLIQKIIIVVVIWNLQTNQIIGVDFF
jgi:hypothetical protein